MRSCIFVIFLWTACVVFVSSDSIRRDDQLVNVRHGLRQAQSISRREPPRNLQASEPATNDDETKSFLDIFPEGYNPNSGIYYHMFSSIFQDNGQEPTVSPAPADVSTTATTTLAPTANNSDNGGSSSSSTGTPTMGETPTGDTTDAPTPVAFTAPPTQDGTLNNNPDDPPTAAPTQGGTLDNNNGETPTAPPTQGGTLNNNPGDTPTIAPTQGGTLNNNGEPPTAPPTQGGTLNNNEQPPTAPPSQGGTLNNNGEPPTAPPSQGGTLNNNGDPPTIAPTQGGTLNNNGDPPTIAPTQGGTQNNNGEPPTAPPSQAGTLNSNGEPPTAPPTPDSTLNVNDPGNVSNGGNTTDDDASIEPGTNTTTTTNTTDTNSTEEPIDKGNSTTLATQEPKDGNATSTQVPSSTSSTVSPQEAPNGTETPNDTGTEAPLDVTTTTTLAPTEVNEVGNNTTNLQGNDTDTSSTTENNDGSTTSKNSTDSSMAVPTTADTNTDGNETDGNATIPATEPNVTTLAPTTINEEQVEGNTTLAEANNNTIDNSTTEGVNETAAVEGNSTANDTETTPLNETATTEEPLVNSTDATVPAEDSNGTSATGNKSSSVLNATEERFTFLAGDTETLFARAAKNKKEPTEQIVAKKNQILEWQLSATLPGQVVASNEYGNHFVTSMNGKISMYDLDLDGVIATQVGQFRGSILGSCLAMSGTGNRIVAGGSKHVHVYDRKQGKWTLTDTIFDRSDSGFGRSVALSHDASTIVVGGSNAANAYIQRNGKWELHGRQLQGDSVGDNFGQTVGVNHDGSIVAVGAPSGGGDGQGYTRIFRGSHPGLSGLFRGVTWEQLGSDLMGSTENEHFGMSLSFSFQENSVRIAVGAYEKGDHGHVQVFDFVDNAWQEVGHRLGGLDRGENYGESLVVSADVVAIGASARVGGGAAEVWREQDDGLWHMTGQVVSPPDNMLNASLGRSLALARHGNRLFVSGGTGRGGDADSNVWIYNLVSTSSPGQVT